MIEEDTEIFVFIVINVMRIEKTKYFPKKLIVSIPRSVFLLRVSMAILLHLLPFC